MSRCTAWVNNQFISYIRRNESEVIDFDKCLAPTFFREHSYRYDSFGANMKNIKIYKLKEYNDCPLAKGELKLGIQEIHSISTWQHIKNNHQTKNGILAS